jgi:hypothetical protein
MRKNFLPLLFAVLWFTFNPITMYSAVPSVNFALFTVPKSGSHLLIKTLYFMTGFTPEWHTDPLSPTVLSQNRKFPYTHFCLSPSLQNYYQHSPSIKQIIGVRDLRDVCVSIVHQIIKGPWPELARDKQKQSAFRKLPFDDQLLWVINQEYELNGHIQLQLGIAKVAEQVKKYVQNPDVFICRFEDLVGQRGGGTEEKQLSTIRQLGEYIGISFNPHEVQKIADDLYGNEINPFGKGMFQNYQSTFREGKIGSWENCFKERHKEAFKKRLGSALIALGYEENDDW